MNCAFDVEVPEITSIIVIKPAVPKANLAILKYLNGIDLLLLVSWMIL